MSVDIKELNDQMNDLITTQRDFNESTQKQLDGLDPIDKEQLVKIEKEIADVCAKVSQEQLDRKEAEKKSAEAEEAVEKMLKQIEEADKRFEKLELSVAAGAGTKGSIVAYSKYDSAISEYFRKGDSNGAMVGEIPSREFIDGVGDEIVKAYIKTSDPRIIATFKNLVVGINPDGGYWVTPQFQGVIEGRVFETSPIRQLANVITTTSDTASFILDDDEADSGWVGEVDLRGDTRTAQIGEILIPIHELFAQPKATQKMLDDAGFDVAGWHQRKVSDRFMREENKAFVSGDGSKRPKGFNTYPDAANSDDYERNKIGTIITTNAGVLDEPNDLKDVQNALKQVYQTNATWGMKRLTWSQVTKLKDDDGRYMFELISNLRDGDPLMLLGRPVVLMDDMPDVATGANVVAYSDFSRSYTIADRIGVRVFRDPFTEKPFIKFYTTKRVGGDVTSFDAIKRLQIQ